MKRLLLPVVCLCLTTSISAQSSNYESEEWYLWTDDGARLYIKEIGQAVAAGDTVVVLHGGWGAEHSYLLTAVRPLADQYRFVLYDQRGSLRSPVSDSLITYESMIADLEAIRKELGIGQITLLGHSMGTTLAYHYLNEYPSQVKGLVLIGPVAPVWGAEEWTTIGVDTTRRREAYEAYKLEQETRVAAQLANEGLDRDSLTNKEKTNRWRIEFAGGSLYHTNRWRQMEGGMAFYNDDVGRLLYENASEQWSDWETIRAQQLESLERFEGATRVILGDFDFTDPEALVWPHLIDRFPDAKLTVLEDAGHNAWIDQPEAFRETLSEALQATTD